MKTIAVWLCERIIEVLLAALIMRMILGPARTVEVPYSIESDEIVSIVLILLFYVISLYALTVLLLGLVYRDTSPIRQGAKLAIAFLGNCIFFAILTPPLQRFWVLVSAGVVIVFAVNTIGAFSLNRWQRGLMN